MNEEVRVTVTFTADPEVVDEDGRLGEDAWGELMDAVSELGYDVRISEL